jgi:hypothetical protein
VGARQGYGKKREEEADGLQGCGIVTKNVASAVKGGGK